MKSIDPFLDARTIKNLSFVNIDPRNIHFFIFMVTHSPLRRSPASALSASSLPGSSVWWMARLEGKFIRRRIRKISQYRELHIFKQEAFGNQQWRLEVFVFSTQIDWRESLHLLAKLQHDVRCCCVRVGKLRGGLNRNLLGLCVDIAKQYAWSYISHCKTRMQLKGFTKPSEMKLVREEERDWAWAFFIYLLRWSEVYSSEREKPRKEIAEVVELLAGIVRQRKVVPGWWWWWWWA